MRTKTRLFAVYFVAQVEIEIFENTGNKRKVKMKELTSSQRKVLSAAASKLSALVIIGQNGLSEGIVKKSAECLENHELVKIKFNEFKD